MYIVSGGGFTHPTNSNVPQRFRKPLQQAIAKYLVGLSLLLAMLSGMVRAYAQTNFGTMVGTITDPSERSISGASIDVRNLGTNVTQIVTSSSTGDYSVVNLNPGLYGITVTVAGFSPQTKSPINVKIGGTSRADVTLSVGSISETVTVTSSQNELQTDTSSLGGVVEGRAVLETPLNGRNVNNLLTLVPGVIAGGGTAGSTISNQGGAQTQAIAYGNYQIGGGFSGQSLFYVDGVPSNVPENNVNSLVPTQDAVQEFRVSTNNVSAEFGGFGGGVVQISTKSGVNSLHGSAYEYLRNTVFNANDWFSNHLGRRRPPLHQNQFGANLGGPIMKDKLFFFGSWEREFIKQGFVSINTVPTLAQLNGDFSATGQNIYDVSSPGRPQFSCNGILNVICPNRLDPTASKILAAESPNPNATGLTNNFLATAITSGQQDQYNARLDYALSKSDSLFSRYTFWNPHNKPSDPYGKLTGSGVTGNTTHEAVIGENHIFNAHTIADLRLAYLQNYNFQTPLSNGYNLSQFGAPYAVFQQQATQGLLPKLSIPGYNLGANDSQLYWLNTVYSINGSITQILGKHTLKAGGMIRQIGWTTYSNNQGIQFNSDRAFSSNSTASNSGNALASFLLGTPISTNTTQVQGVHAFFHPFGAYLTDTYQVTKSLTANLGIRWEQPGSYSEKNNRDTILQPDVASPLAAIQNPITGQTQTLKGNLAFVSSSQDSSRREEELHWLLFSPRFGLAYRAFQGTVIRGGYGISYLPANLTQDGPQNSPINSAGTSLSNTIGGLQVTSLANPFPNGILLPSGRTPAGITARLGQSLVGRVSNQPYSYVQQYNVAVEQALGANSVFSIAYAAAKGTHLTLQLGNTSTGLNLNQLTDNYQALGAQLLTPVANPFYGILPAGTLGGATILTGYLLKPFPQYQAVTQTVPRIGASTYNALQATYQLRVKGGGLVGAAYTWAKLLSNVDSTSGFLDGLNRIGVVQDNTNLHLEKSLSLQDVRHHLVLNYGIDLPFGTGHKFLPTSGIFINTLVGGWRVNGITSFLTGTPLSFVANANPLSQFFGAGIIRPNRAQGCEASASGPAQSRVTKWFNRACFVQPGPFSFGNESRVDSQLRNAGVANFDASLSKTINIADWSSLQLSAEAFNVFNRVQFGPPTTNLSSGIFGQVTSQANSPRTLQLALRYSF